MGAILINGEAIGVIELKSTKTKDIESIRKQAFDYKANHKSCVYVVTSNFEKLRFYINNAVEYEEFNLFNITKDRFSLLYLCLNNDYLLNNIPLKIKDESLVEEEAVTKKLYSDYSEFKRELFQDIVVNNLNNLELEKEQEIEQKKLLFKKTQKLIDRILFILFCEDRGLLPPNEISKIISEWEKLKDLDAYTPLYERFRKHFGYINTGYKKDGYEIFAYNGGLFEEDEVLKDLKITDEVLRVHTKKLTSYDFESEVDVDILGHIFEQSITEIETVTAEIEGVAFDKNKSRRKKEGVYYTPKYITKYIVDNTVGKLCEEKKNELGIVEEEYFKGKKNRNRKIILELEQKLDHYQKYLLTLRICDPACGSGAFLNQVLELLIIEHRYIAELKAKLFEQTLVLSDVENEILEKNLYGVDINEEAIEIAKLSLWLRTAKKGRKLTSLNENIKCGNSLIDDPEVAGGKAFKWEQEFPDVFANGGFDVVLGNPPYVRQELLGEIKFYLENSYKVYEGTSDLFTYFYEKSLKLLKLSGFFGFISNTFDKTKAANKLRRYLTKEAQFINYVDFTEFQVFEGTTTYPIILIARKLKESTERFHYTKIPKNTSNQAINIDSEKTIEVSQNSLESESWSFNSIISLNILSKLNKNQNIKDQFGKCYYGIKTGFNEAFIIDKKTKNTLDQTNSSSRELIKPFYEGKDISKWNTPCIEKYIIFSRRGTDIEAYPAIKQHLEAYKERLTPRNSPEIKVGRKPGQYKWFEIQDSVDYYPIFDQPKITWPNLQATNKFCLDNNGYYINAPSVVFPSDSKTLLCILNSKPVWFFLKSVCVIRSGGYLEIKPQYFEQIPIPKLRNEKVFENKADDIIEKVSEYQNISLNFLHLLQSKFEITKPSKKLKNWCELEFNDFLKEIKKSIIKLSLSEEAEWMEYFNEQKAKALELKAEIGSFPVSRFQRQKVQGSVQIILLLVLLCICVL